MKSEQTRWRLPFLLFMFCSPAPAQTIAASNDTAYLSEDFGLTANLDGATQLDDDYYVPATGFSYLGLYLMGLIHRATMTTNPH